MIRVVLVACGLVVIAANLPSRADRLALVGIALSVVVVGAVGAVRERCCP